MGTLKINTAGLDDFAMIITCIKDPYEIKKKIKEIKHYSLSSN